MASTTTSQSVASSPLQHLSYQQLDILHALRGFCAFYVVIFHARYILWAGGRQYLEAFPRSTWKASDYGVFLLDMLSSAGHEMVLFFFVLSGFFIRYSQQRKQRTTASFYLNRITRIYPPFLFSALLAVITLYILAYQVPSIFTTGNGRELNQSLTGAWAELKALRISTITNTLAFLRADQYFIGYNTVYWSLLPEALFYLCVPFVLRIPRFYYGSSAALFLVGLFLNYKGIELSLLANYGLKYNFYFALGAALHDTAIYTMWLKQIKAVPKRLLLSLLLGLSTALVGTSIMKYGSLPDLLAATLAIFTISILLTGRVIRTNPLIKLFHFIGVYSFSLYLYHYPLLLLSYGLIVKATGQLIIYNHLYWLVLPFIMAACYGLYWITERVAIQYFRK